MANLAASYAHTALCGLPFSADVLKYVCDAPRSGRSSAQGSGASMQQSSGDGEAASQATAEMSEADLEDDMAEQEEIIVYQVGLLPFVLQASPDS